MTTTWRCLLGREQRQACLADGGYCYTGACPHGRYIPKGETERRWRARMDKEWDDRKERERNEGQTAKEWDCARKRGLFWDEQGFWPKDARWRAAENERLKQALDEALYCISASMQGCTGTGTCGDEGRCDECEGRDWCHEYQTYQDIRARYPRREP